MRRLAVLMCATVAFGDSDTRTWNDVVGDATIRRTDGGADGAIQSGIDLPDIVSLSASSWKAFSPASDPYTGIIEDVDDAHLFRLELVVQGLVNPPGTIGVDGHPFDPFTYGPNPMFGFIDLDVDDRKDTGGELDGAEVRYLANVARFGARPYGSIGERIAERGADLDFDFYSSPEYERTGADFALVLCGCTPTTIVNEGGDQDQIFDAGETWVVSGRHFERAKGFQEACASFGGSDFGLYDPIVKMRYSHDISTNRTTITMVEALDMTGAAQLTGQSQQSMDLNVANHHSMAEALVDLIAGASDQYGGPVDELIDGWEGRDYDDGLAPGDWEATAIVGVSYLTEQADAIFVWTDVGFAEIKGDYDADGFQNNTDIDWLVDLITSEDGGSNDADGMADGVVTLFDFGPNFDLYDANGDGLIGDGDLLEFCYPADFNQDGDPNIFDVLGYLARFEDGDPVADLNRDGIIDIFDVIHLLAALDAGCP